MTSQTARHHTSEAGHRVGVCSLLGSHWAKALNSTPLKVGDLLHLMPLQVQMSDRWIPEVKRVWLPFPPTSASQPWAGSGHMTSNFQSLIMKTPQNWTFTRSRSSHSCYKATASVFPQSINTTAQGEHACLARTLRALCVQATAPHVTPHTLTFILCAQ